MQLAARGTIRLAELDTSHFKGNAPGWASLSGCDTQVAEPDEEGREAMVRRWLDYR